MIFSFIGGIILGLIFFGGLYYTTKKLSIVKRPALFVIASIVLRMAILIGGLYFIFSGDIIRLLIAIVGVFISKYIAIYFVKKEVI